MSMIINSKNSDDKVTWLASSASPDTIFIKKIEEIVRQLETTTAGNKHKFLEQKKLAVRGELSSVLASLTEILNKDYRTNASEADNAPYEFEYIISTDGLEKNAAAILTRLFSHNRPGNIFYGSIIIRERKDHFSLWVDEE